mmetsp:Transcript_6677/g.13260  ORF Transcript_6677/g.13260 Transcript_6677/m.13260 type:complete len:211 (-) Transcript_6677:1208-1840(-)
MTLISAGVKGMVILVTTSLMIPVLPCPTQFFLRMKSWSTVFVGKRLSCIFFQSYAYLRIPQANNLSSEGQNVSLLFQCISVGSLSGEKLRRIFASFPKSPYGKHDQSALLLFRFRAASGVSKVWVSTILRISWIQGFHGVLPGRFQWVPIIFRYRGSSEPCSPTNWMSMSFDSFTTFSSPCIAPSKNIWTSSCKCSLIWLASITFCSSEK